VTHGPKKVITGQPRERRDLKDGSKIQENTMITPVVWENKWKSASGDPLGFIAPHAGVGKLIAEGARKKHP